MRAQNLRYAFRGEDLSAPEPSVIHQHLQRMAQLLAGNPEPALRRKERSIASRLISFHAMEFSIKKICLLFRRAMTVIVYRAFPGSFFINFPLCVQTPVNSAQFFPLLPAEIGRNIACRSIQLLKNMFLLITVKAFSRNHLNDRP